MVDRKLRVQKRIGLITISIAFLILALDTAPQETRPQGKIHEDLKEPKISQTVRVRVAKLHEIKTGNEFHIMKDEKEKFGQTIIVKRTTIAIGIVTDIKDFTETEKLVTCVLSYVKGKEEIKKGMHAEVIITEKPDIPPFIEKIETTPLEPRWGDNVEIKVTANDLDDKIKAYEWEINRGVLSSKITTLPFNSFVCPYEEGKVRLTVTAIDEKNNKSIATEHTIELKGVSKLQTAIDKISVENVFGGNSKHYTKIQDITQDENGDIYILDSNIRRVIKLSRNLEMLWMTEPGYKFDSNFSNIAARGENVYLVDTISRSVLRFAAKSDMFKTKPLTIGKDELKHASKIAVNERSQLYAMDTKGGGIKIFDEKGGLLTFIGKGKESMFKELSLMKYIGDKLYCYDKGNFELIIFKDTNPEKRVSTKGLFVVDFTLHNDTIYIATKNTIIAVFEDSNEKKFIVEEKAPAKDDKFWNFNSIKALLTQEDVLVLTDKDTLIRLEPKLNTKDRKIDDLVFKGLWGLDDLNFAELISVSRYSKLALYCPKKKAIFLLDKDGWILDKISSDYWKDTALKSITVHEDNEGLVYFGLVPEEDKTAFYMKEQETRGQYSESQITELIKEPLKTFESISSTAFAGNVFMVIENSGAIHIFKKGKDEAGKDTVIYEKSGSLEVNGNIFRSNTGHFCHISEKSFDVFKFDVKELKSEKLKSASIEGGIQYIAGAYDGIGGLFLLLEGEFSHFNFDTNKARVIVSGRVTRNVKSFSIDYYSRLYLLEKNTGKIFKLRVDRK